MPLPNNIPFPHLSLAVYRVRVTPVSTLRRVVRVRFTAAEYPSSLGGLEGWSSDEAVPEMFLDSGAQFMRATEEHRALGMDDLLVPWWSLDGAACAPPVDEAQLRSCGTQRQFIACQRALLSPTPPSHSVLISNDAPGVSPRVIRLLVNQTLPSPLLPRASPTLSVSSRSLLPPVICQQRPVWPSGRPMLDLILEAVAQTTCLVSLTPSDSHRRFRLHPDRRGWRACASLLETTCSRCCCAHCA